MDILYAVSYCQLEAGSFQEPAGLVQTPRDHEAGLRRVRLGFTASIYGMPFMYIHNNGGITYASCLLPLEAQIACVRREIRQRKSVYPRLVQDGRMLEATAAQELVAMQAVLRTLTALLEARQGELFGEETKE